MPDRPITIITPVIQRVLDGTCSVLRRPKGALAACQPGDRLWIREQFILPARFDGIAPLQALATGASPVFATDLSFLPNFATADLGRRRFAREMPKLWYRAHLVVDDVRIDRLQAIAGDEIEREGFDGPNAYAAAWDAGVSLSGWSSHWAANPEVLVFTFRAICAPLPEQKERFVA